MTVDKNKEYDKLINMTQEIILKVKSRSKSDGTLSSLRNRGLIPAVLYGKNAENQNLAVEYAPFLKVYKKAGESALVDLQIGNKPVAKVLIQEIQINPLTDKIIHVDFRKVLMTEKIETEIPLKFVGESAAVQEQQGTLVKSKDALRVRCLPGFLLSEIEVDLSPLKVFDDLIRVKDLILPKEIEILENLEDAVVAVVKTQVEEEKPVEEAVGKIEEVEVAEEKKLPETGEEEAKE